MRMEPEEPRETKQIGKDSPPLCHPVDTPVTCDSPCLSKVTEANTTDHVRPKENERRSGDKPLNKKKGEETLVLKMNDGRTVTCKLVCDGQEKYLKEVPPEKSDTNQKDSKMLSESNKPSSFSRSSQFVSSVNSLLEESSTNEEPGAESFKRSTLELFEPIPSRLLKNQPNSQQWTEQGRRLASFVEDSIYRSLKSNDADVVKEWQLKMSTEAFQERLLDESKSRDKHLDKSGLSEGSNRSHYPPASYPTLDGEHAGIPPHTIAEGSSIAKNGKISLLDVLREKLRRTLLNYDQQIKQDSQSVTRSIDTLFFSPAVESTTPDSQSAMPSSSDDVFRVEEPPYGYCEGDSGSNSTDESCSDRPSSTQSSFPPSSSKLEGGMYQETEVSLSEGALDLSCSSQKVKEADAERQKRPSTSDFSLERILARPDPKPKQKHNPFMQTFSDLLDLPPREIKNKEPFKVKRRPYRRRRGIHHGQYSKHSDGAEGGIENEMGSATYEGGMSKGSSTHVNPQAPIGYLAITEDEYQRSLANASGSTDADWPSVALLMNVYSEWKLKNRGITPPSPLTGELGGHGLPIPGMASGFVKSSLASSASPPPTQRDSPLSPNAPYRSSSCSSDCSSRSAGHVYSKKSRLLQNVGRSCSCKSHSKKVVHSESAPLVEEGTKSSIRSLLDEERLEKKRSRVDPSSIEDHDSDSEDRIKRPRVAYREGRELPLKRDPDGQGVCVIS